jgi:hypothetical protein
MFFPVLIQTRDGRFNGNRPVTPEPAFVLAGEALRAPLFPELRIPSESGLAILQYQDAPIELLASFHADMRFATKAFFFINNDLYGPLFKVHELTPPLSRVPCDIP